MCSIQIEISPSLDANAVKIVEISKINSFIVPFNHWKGGKGTLRESFIHTWGRGV